MIRLNGKILACTLMICFLALIGPTSAFCKQVDEKILMHEIRQHIDNNMLWPAENVRIELLSGLPNVENVNGKVTLRIESRSREEYIGDTSFNVRIFVNNIFFKEVPVRVRIEVLREFVISRNNISRDAILSDNDVTVQKKWVKNIPMNALASLDEAIGKTIVVSVRPNMQITRSMLKSAMPVRKGKMVQVILDNGVMKMMMNGVAEEDGAEDALVKVRNLSSNKVIHARVVGQAKVQIDF
ncbi:MAG: flagella basal body P-ring formation protein FlgA [Deltaproteobacteria bacterium HGW-Deltaproteobacteria-6]|jgi:flagella basal body P-ring formation protein FlgA|nr:MAG: flagella basal body P-ring formation protein FlgA [Deltaproteobacteria bacterium HGW-Deltaproteobacteria-6]